MTKKEIIAALTAAGIEHNPKSTNPELLALLPAGAATKSDATHKVWRATSIVLQCILPATETPEDERLTVAFEGTEDECQNWLNTH